VKDALYYRERRERLKREKVVQPDATEVQPVAQLSATVDKLCNQVATMQQQIVALQVEMLKLKKETPATKPSKPIYETEQTALGPRIVLSGEIHPVSKDCSRVHVREG
jgi:hypothetical protein